MASRHPTRGLFVSCGAGAPASAIADAVGLTLADAGALLSDAGAQPSALHESGGATVQPPPARPQRPVACFFVHSFNLFVELLLIV